MNAAVAVVGNTLGVVTTTSTAPIVAWAGVVMVTCVASVNTSPAAVPPTVAVELPVQEVPVPVRTTDVPPAVDPEVVPSVIVPAGSSDWNVQRESFGEVVDNGFDPALFVPLTKVKPEPPGEIPVGAIDAGDVKPVTRVATVKVPAGAPDTVTVVPPATGPLVGEQVYGPAASALAGSSAASKSDAMSTAQKRRDPMELGDLCNMAVPPMERDWGDSYTTP